MLSLDHEYLKALLVRIDLLEQRCEKLEGGQTTTPQSVVEQLKQQLAEEVSRSIKCQNERRLDRLEADEWKRKYEEHLTQLAPNNKFKLRIAELEQRLAAAREASRTYHKAWMDAMYKLDEGQEHD